MRYCSIDIETAGLGRDCSLLEFGAVIDDLANPQPLEELPKFHTYILNERIVGEPYALAMHKTILERIARQEEPWSYLLPNNLQWVFSHFLATNGYEAKTKGKPVEITVAGKNFATFDKDWLEPLFKETVRFHRRVIDPSILYLRLGEDKTLPASKECMERSGLSGEVAHTALEDALMVVKLLRRHYYH